MICLSNMSCVVLTSVQCTPADVWVIFCHVALLSPADGAFYRPLGLSPRLLW